MDEWCDNFEVYLKCLVKQQSSNRKAAEGSQPLWPSARSAGLKFGIPRGASSSTRSLPVSIGQRAALASRGAQSTRSMIQTPGMASRRSGRGFSDTACDYAEGVQSSSASWTSGQRRPSQADALSTKSLSNRRLSLLMEETPIRSAGTGPRSPAAKQSDRSVVPLVRDKKKEAHFIVGHAGLNRRSDSDAFKAKLVRRKSLKVRSDDWQLLMRSCPFAGAVSTSIATLIICQS